MSAPEPGAKVAKDLGIYLGQIYAYVKKGAVTNHKVGGYPDGKGIEVDPEEVKAAMASSRRRGGKGGGKPKGSAVRRSSSPTGSLAEEEAKRVAKATKAGFKDGQLLSYHKGVTPGKDYGHAVRVVAGKYGSKITYLSENDRYHSFATGTLREWIAKGVAHLESPEGILGLVMFSWISTGKVELAAGLEAWMEAHDLPVSIPDPILTDEVAGQVVEDQDEDGVLAGEDDDD